MARKKQGSVNVRARYGEAADRNDDVRQADGQRQVQGDGREGTVAEVGSAAQGEADGQERSRGSGRPTQTARGVNQEVICAYCGKAISATDGKATIQGTAYHSGCWDRKAVKGR